MPRCFATGMAVFLGFGCVMLLAGCPNTPDVAPAASFTATPRDGNVPLTVQFQDTSSPGAAPIKAWSWTFGNGETSTRPDPVVTYYAAGDYKVTLTVTNAYGSNTQAIPGFVRVAQSETYGIVGSAGGAITLDGVKITVNPGVFAADVHFGVGTQDRPTAINQFEEMVVVSPTYLIRHDAPSEDVFSSVSGAAVQPATIDLPFQLDSVPVSGRTGDKIQILAQLDSALTIPIPGTIVGDHIVAQVMRMPAHAFYTVVYRPNSFVSLATLSDSKAVTGFAWRRSLRIYSSDTLLKQLTALRLGTIAQPQPYGRTNFTNQEITDTVNTIAAGFQLVMGQLPDSGLRAPALIDDGTAYSLLTYDMNEKYSLLYPAFHKLAYRDHTFGNIVLDPRQLLFIAMHNAEAAKDPDNVDEAQPMPLVSAFAQELFDASFDGYDYPSFTTASAADDKPVQALDGLKEAASAYLGQVFGAMASSASQTKLTTLPTPRGFEANEYALLSQPLFTAFAPDIADYAVSGQDFLFYTLRTMLADNANADPFAYLLGHSPLARGVLEQTRLGQDALPVYAVYADATEALLVATDTAYQAKVGKSLSDLYWSFAKARAVNTDPLGVLRPSDAKRTPLTFNADRFETSAVVTGELPAATDQIEITPSSAPALASIPPFSSRAIVLKVNPLSTNLSIAFNAQDWDVDADGQQLAVSVFQPNKGWTDLSASGVDTDQDGIPDTLNLSTFYPDPDECYSPVTILASNLSKTSTSSLSLTANSVASLNIAESDVLQRFIYTCDPNYTYSLYSSATVPTLGVNVYVLQMTSGAWRGADQVDQVLWKHFITILEPPIVTTDTAMLMVTGGSTGTLPDASVATLLAPFCLSTGSVVASIQAVPNEPLEFANESKTRSEDAIIAYSYDKYMTGFAAGKADMAWPALLPMTRAAVRAMDSVQKYMLLEKPGTPAPIQHFAVSGASKRGWTTWLTAAADPRVTMIMPIVIDVLNMKTQMQHQFNAYDGYSEAVQDYVNSNVFARFGDPEGASLLKIVDPYSYRAKLTMPKFVVNSTGDQFFLPDSTQFYWSGLTGPKYLYYAPNTDHSLGSTSTGTDAGTLNSLEAFYNAFVRDVDMPKFSWVVKSANQIVMTTQTPPKTVKLWQATNPKGRDFRLETIGEKWVGTTLAPDPADATRYVANVAAPTNGWTAFFIQMTYPGPDANLPDADFGFSTQVVVTPDTYPSSAK